MLWRKASASRGRSAYAGFRVAASACFVERCGVTPHARVEPMRVQLKPGASAVKGKPRWYDPVKTSWLASCVAGLLAFGLVFRNLRAAWSSPAMAVPNKDSFRLVNDYEAVNEQVEKSPDVMPNQEADMVDLLSARFFGKSDLLQGLSLIHI